MNFSLLEMKSQLVYFMLIGVAVLAQTSWALKEEDCEGMYERMFIRMT